MCEDEGDVVAVGLLWGERGEVSSMKEFVIFITKLYTMRYIYFSLIELSIMQQKCYLLTFFYLHTYFDRRPQI